ncbi:hypothetical protein RERY_29500 [Rhodococcus erythropolis]|nr:hypothetical protein RERY_29500 [Rhodococcus erythropolis]
MTQMVRNLVDTLLEMARRLLGLIYLTLDRGSSNLSPGELTGSP